MGIGRKEVNYIRKIQNKLDRIVKRFTEIFGRKLIKIIRRLEKNPFKGFATCLIFNLLSTLCRFTLLIVDQWPIPEQLV